MRVASNVMLRSVMVPTRLAPSSSRSLGLGAAHYRELARAHRPQGPFVAHECAAKGLEAGWYLGTIKLYGVSNAWKEVCPTANFLVKYTKKETDNMLAGDEAAELTAHQSMATSGGCSLSGWLFNGCLSAYKHIHRSIFFAE